MSYADEIDAFKAGRTNRMARVTNLLVQGRHAEAETLLAQMARDDPDSETPLVHLGRILINRGNWAAAEQALGAALRPGLERLQATLANLLDPVGHGRARDAEDPGSLGLLHAVLDGLHGAQA